MGCNHPLKAFDTGELTENGKPLYVIAASNRPVFPYREALKITQKPSLNVETLEMNGSRFLINPVDIPCGKCVGCRMAHAKEWAVRCTLEKEYYSDDECLFLTLTYRNKDLPQDKQLRKKDLQDFWKRLRFAGYRFRYFACGEYGETYQRPHYHAIVFGLRLSDLKFKELSGSLSQLYESEELTRIWAHGLAVVGYADSASIAYVSGYVEKKQRDPRWDSYLVKPFLTMSRKPALGTRYLEDNEDVIIATNKVYGNFGNVHHHSVPRHFLRKLGTKDETWYAGRSLVMQERGKAAKLVDRVTFGCDKDWLIGEMKDEILINKLNEIERS